MKYLLLSLIGLLFSMSLLGQKARLDIEENNDFSGFELYQESLDSFTVFINGENHLFQKSNAALQLKMIKYLHKNAGVKTLLLELGWSRGYVITEYIQKGDTTLLPAIEGYSWKYYIELVEGLKLFNDSLPQEEKISVVGIDVERFSTMAIKALSMQLPVDKQPHDSIAVAVESIFSLNAYMESKHEWDDSRGGFVNDDYSSLSSDVSLDFLLKDLNKYKDYFLDYIAPEKEQVFLKILAQLNDRQKYQAYDNEGAVQSYIYREIYMYNQFMDLYKADSTQKYFMQFGRCHSVKVFQEKACSWYNYNSIAQRINTSSYPNLKGKVLSTAIYYPESTAWSDMEGDVKKHLKEVYLDQSVKDELTIWDVAQDSVFLDKHDFIIVNQKSLKTEKDPKEINSYIDEEIIPTTYFVVRGGMNQLNYSDVSNFLENEDYTPYARKGSWGVDLGYFKNHGAYVVASFTSTPQKKFISTLSANDTLNVSPYYLHFDFGKDLIRTEKVDLIPYLGLGYEGVRFVKNDYSTSGIVANSVKTVANSSSFNGRLGLRTQVNLNGFVIGLDYNYILNIGKTSWSENSKDISGAPRFRTKGSVVSGFAGFLF